MLTLNRETRGTTFTSYRVMLEIEIFQFKELQEFDKFRTLTNVGAYCALLKHKVVMT